MNWNKLSQTGQIQEIKALSDEKPVMIFKHSTRCSISSMALDRLMRKWQNSDNEKLEPYILDLITNRALSDQIATTFGVSHESPQVIIIKNGEVIYDVSHYSISYSDILKSV